MQVIYHGYNVPFEDAVFRTAQVAYDLQFDGAPVLYSWPSEAGLLAYGVDANNADWTGAHLRWFLEDLATRTQAQAIHVIAHSLGNKPVLSALSRIVMESAPAVRAKFGQVALTAPDVDTGVFRQLASAFTRAAARVTLYASSNDVALMTSKKLQGGQRAGDTQPTVLVVDGVETIDVSATNTDGMGLGHSYYAERTTIISDLYYLLGEGRGADGRAGLDPVGQPPRRYWRFRR